EWLPKLLGTMGDSERSGVAGASDFRADPNGIWFAAGAAGNTNAAEAGCVGLWGQYLCVANPERTRLLRWNLVTGQKKHMVADGPPGASVFTSTGTRRVAYGANQTLEHWQLSPAGGTLPRTLADLPTRRQIQLQAAWESPDSRWLLVSFRTPEDEILAGLWDLSTGHLAHPDLLPIAAHRLQAEFSTDSQRLLLRSDLQVQILDLPGCKLLLPDERFETAAYGWSRDGRWFAGQVQGQTHLYRVNSLLTVAPQVLETPVPKEISFQNNSGWLALMLPRGRVAFYEQSVNQTFSFQDSVHPHEIDAQGFGYSPDGQWYALAHEDGNVRVWNIHTHQPWTGILRHPGAVRALCWSSGGDLLATCTQNGLVTVWDLSPRASGQIFFHPEAANLQSVRFSPDGQRVAVAGDRGLPVIWNVAAGEKISQPRRDGDSQFDRLAGSGPVVHDPAPSVASEERVSRLNWTRDGAWLVSLSTPKVNPAEPVRPRLKVDVWDSEYGLRQPFTPDFQPLHPATVAEGLRPLLTADNRLLVPEVGRASLLGAAGSETLRLAISKHSHPLQIEMSPDSGLAAVLDSDGVISLFGTQSETVLHRLQLPPGQQVASLTFNAAGTMLAVVGQLGLQVWDTASGKLLTPSFNADMVALRQVCFSLDGRHVATVSENHVCQIRSTKTWNWRGGGFQLESRPVLAEFSPRDNTFVTATEAGLVQIWDWSRGEPLTPPFRHPSSLTDADLSADGRQIAVVGGDCLRVWNLPEPNSLAPEKIAAWAREVALTDVNTADGTLAPLLPNQFPDHPFQKSQQPANSVVPGCESRCRWHLHQANLAHLLRDASAEEFHIRHLSELHPDHPQLPILRSRQRP
ncbi:MAG: repeat-containing protein, partial [Planctomycetaceae bacterium]|nr:repeat-containing protein [Planctomycetaceae bacterium]